MSAKNKFTNKDIHKFVKEIKNQVSELEIIPTKKHTKLFISQKNHSGKIIKLPLIIMPSTPSKNTWKRMKVSDINRVLRENNCPEIIKRYGI